MNSHAEWTRVATDLRRLLGNEVWDSWFSSLTPQSTQDGITLAAPDTFTAEWINNNYGYSLRKLNVSVAVTEGLKRKSEVRFSTNLNPEMTVENFVTGSTNYLAFEVIKKLDSRQLPYTPLCINGQSGVGKTHLLHAIGWKMLKRGMKLLYLPSDRFLQRFVKAARERNIESFVEELISSDGILFDDFQFIVGKQKTQEQFFKIFNSIIESRKLMIISSDQPTSEFGSLHERMRSRLGGGMTATIHPPNYELKLALIRAWDKEIPDDVAHTLAELEVSTRELKGALIRVTVHASCSKRDLTPRFARQVLRDLVSSRGLAPTIEDIMSEVLAYAQKNMTLISEEGLRGRERTGAVAKMRQVFMYLAHEMASSTPSGIGKYLNRDRKTIGHGISKVKEELGRDEQFARMVGEIRGRLGG